MDTKHTASESAPYVQLVPTIRTVESVFAHWKPCFKLSHQFHDLIHMITDAKNNRVINGSLIILLDTHSTGEVISLMNEIVAYLGHRIDVRTAYELGFVLTSTPEMKHCVYMSTPVSQNMTSQHINLLCNLSSCNVFIFATTTHDDNIPKHIGERAVVYEIHSNEKINYRPIRDALVQDFCTKTLTDSTEFRRLFDEYSKHITENNIYSMVKAVADEST